MKRAIEPRRKSERVMVRIDQNLLRELAARRSLLEQEIGKELTTSDVIRMALAAWLSAAA